jgi:hypothetical protein
MANRSLEADEILHLLDEIDTDIDEDTDIEPDDRDPTETIHIVNRLDAEAEDEPIIIELDEQAEIIPTDAASETPVIGLHPRKWRKKEEKSIVHDFVAHPKLNHEFACALDVFFCIF